MRRLLRVLIQQFKQQRLLQRHCEPPGPREARPDDRLREAIQKCGRGDRLDCFGALRLAMTV
jgi:hypothetical protein